jgi:multidrug efflux pump subunit AcrB
MTGPFEIPRFAKARGATATAVQLGIAAVTGVLALGVVLAAIGGCSRPAPPGLVKVVVTFPGAGSEEMEQAVCKPVVDAVSTIAGVAKISSISTQGRAELFVWPASDVDATDLAAQIDEVMERTVGRLPDGAQPAMAEVLAGQAAPPTPPAEEVPTAKLQIDRARAAALGLSVGEVSEAVKGLPPTPEALMAVELKTQDGSTVRLGQVAEVEIVYEPKFRRRDWPAGGPSQ